MKVISIDRELNIIITFKNLNIKLPKKGNISQKNCQEINTKNILVNSEMLTLNHKFPKAIIFFLFIDISEISHCIG